MKICKFSISIFLCLIILTHSTLYSVSPDFVVSYAESANELAHVVYNQKNNEEGWNYLYVYASPHKGLLEQHRGAGFLEGYVTYKEIYSASNNMASAKTGFVVTPKIQGFIDEQLEYIQKMSATFPRDTYWQYVSAYLDQAKFMYRGFLTRLHQESRLDMYIGFSQFMYLTYMGDLRELLHLSDNADKDRGNCNAYVKLVNGQFYAAHTTHNTYQFMLRIIKSYNFPVRDPSVGSQTITFSSRPGDLNSKDDFYVLSSGLKVLETSLQNYNPANYLELSPKSVPCWIRNAVAGNLAKTGQEWINIFLRQRSGTHINQWMIIDKAQLPTKKNVVVFLEQAFSIFEVSDMTQSLFANGYVASYNVGYHPTISKKLDEEKYPYTFFTDPRAVIFKKYNRVMNNEEDMKKWLLTNEEEDVREGLAPRNDLYAPAPEAFGIVDTKLISPSSEKDNYLWAIAGPSTSNGRFPSFDWRNWPKVIHEGMPNVYNFTWVKVPIDIEKPIPIQQDSMQEEKLI